MLTKPVPGIAILHDTATVGIDVAPIFIQPQFTALYSSFGFGSESQDHSSKE